MQQQDKATLCKSANGRVKALNSGVAYELKFKDILLILTSQQFDALKRYLENLDSEVWFRATDEAQRFGRNAAPAAGSFRHDQSTSKTLLEERQNAYQLIYG